ncbi:MAG: hypothetical protein AAFY31_13005 [Pseudomonadota bacterium]
MAISTFAGHPRFIHQVWLGLITTVQIVGRALTVNASAEARLRQVQNLQAMTDDELASLGIERDRIVQHVFRDLYLV